MKRLHPDYYIGCLLGGAVGDALGGPVEFFSYARIQREYGPSGVTGHITHGEGQGHFTDDTHFFARAT